MAANLKEGSAPMFKGFDFFTTRPNKFRSVRCRVCGEECAVTRNVQGSVGWITGLAGKSVLHDEFRCKHAAAEWHRKALELAVAEADTPSQTIAGIIRRERANIIQKHRR